MDGYFNFSLESKSSLSLEGLSFKRIPFDTIIFTILTDPQVPIHIYSFVLSHSLFLWPFCSLLFAQVLFIFNTQDEHVHIKPVPTA